MDIIDVLSGIDDVISGCFVIFCGICSLLLGFGTMNLWMGSDDMIYHHACGDINFVSL